MNIPLNKTPKLLNAPVMQTRSADFNMEQFRQNGAAIEAMSHAFSAATSTAGTIIRAKENYETRRAGVDLSNLQYGLNQALTQTALDVDATRYGSVEAFDKEWAETIQPALKERYTAQLLQNKEEVVLPERVRGVGDEMFKRSVAAFYARTRAEVAGKVIKQAQDGALTKMDVAAQEGNVANLWTASVGALSAGIQPEEVQKKYYEGVQRIINSTIEAAALKAGHAPNYVAAQAAYATSIQERIPEKFMETFTPVQRDKVREVLSAGWNSATTKKDIEKAQRDAFVERSEKAVNFYWEEKRAEIESSKLPENIPQEKQDEFKRNAIELIEMKRKEDLARCKPLANAIETKGHKAQRAVCYDIAEHLLRANRGDVDGGDAQATMELAQAMGTDVSKLPPRPSRAEQQGSFFAEDSEECKVRILNQVENFSKEADPTGERTLRAIALARQYCDDEDYNTVLGVITGAQKMNAQGVDFSQYATQLYQAAGLNMSKQEKLTPLERACAVKINALRRALERGSSPDQVQPLIDTWTAELQEAEKAGSLDAAMNDIYQHVMRNIDDVQQRGEQAAFGPSDRQKQNAQKKAEQAMVEHSDAKLKNSSANRALNAGVYPGSPGAFLYNNR